MSFCISIRELGEDLCELYSDHAEWSVKTFGSDADRGPIGALRHLEKEAAEAQGNPTDSSEYADCLLLILDASRRAGIGLAELINAAAKKMEVNKSRRWPEPTPDEPVEHLEAAK